MQVRYIRAVAVGAVFVVLTGCGTKSISQTNSGFDGSRAYEILKKQCSFGPRYPGSAAQGVAADYIVSELSAVADEVVEHPFTQTVGGKKLPFRNIYAVFNPDAARFVLLCAHWDTRPFADQEVDPAKRNKPILGANDGASGVAVLLELARMFHAKKPPVGVVMAFFDGEDYGKTPAEMFIGSREFAKNWKTKIRPKGRRISYDYGILLDMVGDKDLRIPKEQLSVQSAPKVVDKVWVAAAATGNQKYFPDEQGYAVNDDHVPLLDAKIKCIDLIDFDYGPWHTLDDTPDKCSAKSLQIVGDVVSRVIYDERGE